MPLSAEQFAEQLPDRPDAGWAELEAGEIVSLDPPDDAHGNIVLNLSKSLGAYLAERRDDLPGYACFDVGLVVARDPDSVRRPAVSVFTGGLFARTEELITEDVPALVIEAAATAQRRRALKSRIATYHAIGISHIWVADPVDGILHVCSQTEQTRQFSADETFRDEHVLPGYSITVAELFAEPSWWRGA